MIDIKILSHFPRDEQLHTDAVLILVFRGAVLVKTSEESRFLKKGDMYIINSDQAYSINIEDEGILCCLYIHYKKLCTMLELPSIYFNNTMEQWSQIEIKEFRDLLNQLISTYIHHIQKERCLFEADK